MIRGSAVLGDGMEQALGSGMVFVSLSCGDAEVATYDMYTCTKIETIM